MFRKLGFACVALPPLCVFTLEALEATIKVAIPVLILAGIFPLGMLVLVAYSLSYGQGSSLDHYLEFARGGQSATFLVIFASAPVAFLPVLFGEPWVGVSLLFISLGSISLLGLSVAEALGNMLSKADETVVHGSKGKSPFGLALLFLALFLGASKYFSHRPLRRDVIIGLWILLVLGWVSLSSVGGFPATLVGIITAVMAPVGSYGLFVRRVNLSDRIRLKDILNNQPLA